jgi:hypothetical protein
MQLTGAKAVVLTLCLAVSGACSVRLASPYDEQISHRAAKINDEVVAFELVMRRQAGTATGDPRNEANQRRFDEWRASVITMELLSAAADPRVVRCQDILARLPSAVAVDPTDVQAVHEAVQHLEAAGDNRASRDCQTLGIARLGQRISQLWSLYDRYCQVSTKATALSAVGDCASLWTPSVAASSLGLSGPHGFGVDPVLRSIRAIILIQEGKRASAR